MFADLPGHWLPCADADPRGLALVTRHYSDVLKSRRYGVRGGRGFVGPGEKMVLLTSGCDAVWAWLNPKDELRNDHQVGVLCSVFRNESGVRSSDLIREADELAWAKWPDQRRHYTFVAAASVRPTQRPGWCYLKAGWRYKLTASGERYLSGRGRLCLEVTR